MAIVLDEDIKYDNNYIDGILKKITIKNRDISKDIENETPLWGLKGMKPNNLCMPGGSGLSGCKATSIVSSAEKIIEQRKCPYFKEASFETRCMFETFEKYCWSTNAQKDSKG